MKTRSCLVSNSSSSSYVVCVPDNFLDDIEDEELREYILPLFKGYCVYQEDGKRDNRTENMFKTVVNMLYDAQVVISEEDIHSDGMGYISPISPSKLERILERCSKS